MNTHSPSTAAHSIGAWVMFFLFGAFSNSLMSQSLTWTHGFSESGKRLNGVVWTGSQFVAVGAEVELTSDFGPTLWTAVDALVMTSPDGIAWTQRTNGLGTDELEKVIWTGSQLAAVHSRNVSDLTGKSLTISSDGINWTRPLTTPSVSFEDITWTGSRFVAVGSDGAGGGLSSLWYSTNGTSWTRATSAADSQPTRVCWTGSMAVAVGTHFKLTQVPDGSGGFWTNYTEDASMIYTSADGVSWATRTIPGTGLWSVIWDGQKLHALGSGTGEYISADGVTWTKRGTISFHVLKWTGEYLAHIASEGAYSSASHQHPVFLSPDRGVVWTRQTIKGPGGGLVPLINDIASNGTRLVAVCGNEGWTSPISDGGVVTAEILPPAVPKIASPGLASPPGTLITTLTPTLTWTAVSGATGYDILISRHSDGVQVSSQPITAPASSFVLPEGFLLPGVIYNWKLRSKLGTNSSAWSAPLVFITADNIPVPAKVSLVGPGTAAMPGSIVTTVSPGFSWRAVSGALGYGLYAIDMSDGSLVYQNESLGQVTSFAPPAGTFQAGHTYRWNMRARNAVGWGDYSSRLHFQMKSSATLAGPPVTLSPGTAASPGPTLTSLTPTFSWNAVTNALGYGLYIADASTGALVLDKEDLLTVTSFTLPTGILEPGKKYRWNMRAKVGAEWTAYAPRKFFQTTANYAGPQLDSIDPTTIVGSDALQPIILLGTGFRTGAQVLLSWAGKTDYLVPASQVILESDTRIRVLIKTGKVTDTWTAKVRNTDLKTSVPRSFGVTAPVPGTVVIPTALPTPGTYTQPVTVTLTHPLEPAVGIIYTINGSTPDPYMGRSYRNPFIIGASTPVLVKAYASDGIHTASPIYTARYDFKLPVVALPGTAAPLNLAASGTWYLKVTAPAGLSSMTFTATSSTGDCDIYLSNDERLVESRYAGYDPLPTLDNYQFSARTRGIGTETLTVLAPRPGTWYVMLHGFTACPDLVLSTSKIAATGVTAAPTFNYLPGDHHAALQNFTISCADAGAKIFYTLDGSDPANTSKATLYSGSFTIDRSVTVKAIAIADNLGKSRSAVSSATYRLAIAATPLNFTTTTVNEVTYKSASLDQPLRWASTEAVDKEFYFDVPADPAPSSANHQISYPVALIIEHDHLRGSAEIYLRADNGPARTTDIAVKNLPVVNDWGADSYVLGSKVGGKGTWLLPGKRYYGLLRCYGFGLPTALTTTLTVNFQLHSCSLAMPPGSVATLQPNLANTWVIIHGRESSAERLEDMSLALREAPANQVGQVLRLDWSSLAISNWLGSLDEAMFTPAVGKRAHDVLKNWGIFRDNISLIGHSWGSYAAFEFAKETFTADKGKVKRLIALDPATTGTGNYADLKVNFSQYASKSWAFVTQMGAFGREDYALTASESFMFSTFGGRHPVALHSAPIELLTHFLRCNYGSGYTYDEATISPFFTITALDSQPSIIWKQNPGLFLLQGALGFEGILNGELTGLGVSDSDSFDPTKQLDFFFYDLEGDLNVLTSP